MTVQTNLALGIGFATVGIAAATIQFWLWTFPMEPDPGGRDPNGKTTAPPFWRAIHRNLGYVFIALYILLMTQMWGRIGFAFGEESSIATKTHALLGTLIGIILIWKLAVLRILQRFGRSLPLWGTSISAGGIILTLLAAPSARRLSSLPDDPSGASVIVKRNCITCHGASIVFKSEEDHSWMEVVEDMRRIAKEDGRHDPTEGKPREVAAYLDQVLPRAASPEKTRTEEEEHED